MLSLSLRTSFQSRSWVIHTYVTIHRRQNIINATLNGDKQNTVNWQITLCKNSVAPSSPNTIWRDLLLQVRYSQVWKGPGAHLWFVSEAEIWKQMFGLHAHLLLFPQHSALPAGEECVKTLSQEYGGPVAFRGLTGKIQMELILERRRNQPWQEPAGTLLSRGLCSGWSLCLECSSRRQLPLIAAVIPPACAGPLWPPPRCRSLPAFPPIALRCFPPPAPLCSRSKALPLGTCCVI